MGQAAGLRLRALRSQGTAVRLALAVSRRVGGAVVRNRLRRRLREAVRAELAGILPGTDLLISAGPEALRWNFQELRARLREALRRAGAWAEGPESQKR